MIPRQKTINMWWRSVLTEEKADYKERTGKKNREFCMCNQQGGWQVMLEITKAMTKLHKVPIKAGMEKGELNFQIVFWPTDFLPELYGGQEYPKRGIFPLTLLWTGHAPYKSHTGSFWQVYWKDDCTMTSLRLALWLVMQHYILRHAQSYSWVFNVSEYDFSGQNTSPHLEGMKLYRKVIKKKILFSLFQLAIQLE